MNKLILGVVGRALKLYPVKLHAIVVLSNHASLLLTTPDATTLARFMNFVNSNIAREIGRVHDWHDKFWSRRYQNIPVLDAESMVDRLRYLLSHGTKEGLVARPRDWPGVNCIRSLSKGRPLWGIWVDRAASARSRRSSNARRPLEDRIRYEVPLSPLPCWVHLSANQIRRRHRDLIRSIEKELVNTKPLGCTVVYSRHPHDRPLHSKRSPAPLCHAAYKSTRELFRMAYREFVTSYRLASARTRAGVAAPYPAWSILPPSSMWLST